MPQARPVAFTGGRILTMDPALPDPDVVVVAGDRIVAVGARDRMQAHPGATLVDLGGRTLVPGLVDAHHHLCLSALHPRWADCSSVGSVEELAEVLREQALRESDAPWVRGHSWDDLGGLPLARRDLDEVGLERPVVVAGVTLHQGVVSSRGLDVLGIGRSTPDPPGGEIRRGPDGAPTGVLLERAWSLAHGRSLEGYDDPERWDALVATRARRLLAAGITCVHDPAVAPAAEAMYGRLRSRGELPLSVLAMPHPGAFLTHELGDRLDGPCTGEGDEMLRVGAVKLFADGGVAPAVDVHLAGERLAFGTLHGDMAPALVEAVRRGFRVGVHAMGNAGVRAALEAFRDAARARPDDDHRFRIEHAGMASRAQVAAMAALGVVAVVQPGFVDHVGETAAGFEPDDATWLPFADLATGGVTLAGSSDEPCAPWDPLGNAARGVTRRTRTGRTFGPDQGLPYEAWLSAYTAGAAYAGGQEDERGSLTPAKRADLVVLEGPLDADHPPVVAQTWFGGELVHTAARATGGAPGLTGGS